MKKFTFTIEQELKHYGICDSSGAIALGEKHFLVANDEDNLLRIYRSDREGKPIDSSDINDYFDNNPEHKEVDIEATAQLDGIIYWITSGGRNKKGKFKPERHQFFANKLIERDRIAFEQIGKSYTQLVLQDMFRDERLKKYQLEAAEKIPPKEIGGLNIEGLAITRDRQLLIGFRNPIPQGKALLLPLINPLDLIQKQGTNASFGEPIELDLNGLGIRSIEYWEREERYIIVAGAYDGSDRFALYQWSGLDENPELIEELNLPSDFRPECVLFYPNLSDRFQLLSDDGSLPRDGLTPCKDIEDKNHPNKYFRSLWVRVSDR
jgi:hypothetical protein